MKGLKPFLSLLLGCVVCAILGGCAGSTPQSGPGALNIAQFSLSAGVPGIAYKQLLIASGGKTPYTWSVSAGTLPPGLSLTTDGIISGTPTTTGTYNFTVMVVDSQSPTKAVDTAPLAISINPVLSLTSTPLVSGQVGENYAATITASNGVPPYTYSVASGSLPPCSPTPPCSPNLTLTTNTTPTGSGPNSATIGGLVSTGNNNSVAESPTTAGVFNFTIQATDSLGEVATATYSLTVTGLLEGNYAMTFNGFAHGQPFYIAGQFTADGNGNVTSGVIDQNGPNGVSTAVPITGTYTLPSSSPLGTITLQSTALGRYVYSIALSTTSDSTIILVNKDMYGSGLVKKQPPVLALPANGANYTFEAFGNDSSGNRYAEAGTFSISAALSVTGGEQDTNDNGTISNGAVPITGGDLAPDPNNLGRGTATLTTASGTATYTYYIAALDELVAVRIDSGPMTVADFKQQASAGITGSLVLCKAGSTCQSVVEMNGVSTSGGTSVPVAAVGVVAYDGSGNIAGPPPLPGYYTDQSIGGLWSPVTYTTGTYTTDSLGRVAPVLQGATNQPVWYLVSSGEAVALGTDSSVMSGSLQLQTIPATGSFGLINFLGSYLGGTITPTLATVTNEIDAAFTPPPGGDLSLLYETNGPAGAVTTPASFSGNYVIDPTFGPPYGRFAVCAAKTTEYCTSFSYDPNNPPVYILYVLGSGSAGVTGGGKSGLASLNFGQVSNGTATVDPNPRLSEYQR
ncbi:MAG: putative Ig domain-containing protein [Candidatus Korobacteraceae bacterium]|jgi:hypothetical protein